MTHYKILVVDDAITNIQLINYTLRNEYEILAANNGAQAIEIATESLPDLIILDLIMPGINGFDVLRALKENPVTQNIPIIITTSIDDEDQINKVKVFGINEVLNKPFEPHLLQLKVKKLLASRVENPEYTTHK